MRARLLFSPLLALVAAGPPATARADSVPPARAPEITRISSAAFAALGERQRDDGLFADPTGRVVGSGGLPTLAWAALHANGEGAAGREVMARRTLNRGSGATVILRWPLAMLVADDPKGLPEGTRAELRERAASWGSLPLAYHALCTAWAVRALALAGSDASPRLRAATRGALWGLVGLAAPNGEVAWSGRGQDQIWTLTAALYAGAAGSRLFAGTDPVLAARLRRLADVELHAVGGRLRDGALQVLPRGGTALQLTEWLPRRGALIRGQRFVARAGYRLRFSRRPKLRPLTTAYANARQPSLAAARLLVPCGPAGATVRWTGGAEARG